MWTSKRYGKLDVNHGSTQMQPALAKVKFTVPKLQPFEIAVVEADTQLLIKLLDAVFEEGKRERSLEIQTVLNNGERNVDQHTITITDKRK